jgi:UDP-2,3-diacylglucosamine pyrophosphatase LpxH
MAAGYVISDLHLFTPWSTAVDEMGRMQAAARRADFFVLNGDVFDFRWRTHRSLDEATEEAAGWLERFASEHPACRVIYVMGNHDGLAPFAERLEPLAASAPNFEWHPACARVGAALFFHGDLFLRRNESDPFTRRLKPTILKQHAALSRTYRLLHRMRVHRWHAPMVSGRSCARRILRAFDLAADGLTEGVTDVYFGHTHTTFANYRYGGMTFHNTGSLIAGLPWHLMPVALDCDGAGTSDDAPAGATPQCAVFRNQAFG